MNAEVSLRNRHYPWKSVHTDDIVCWFKGTLFYKNKFLRDEGVHHLISLITRHLSDDHDPIKKILLDLNGQCSLLIETPDHIFCAVDRVRSIPLFYSKEEDFILSDDANYLRERLNPHFNEEAGAEFLVTGYVTGSETLFEGIYQIQAGEYLIYNKTESKLTTSYYHRFRHGNYFTDSEEELLTRLDETMTRVFQRLIESTKGLQIVVPLSGGLDSRIIVAMLKRLGVEDVICFTYGKKGNRESEISRQVAEALGYQWLFVEYTHQKWYNYYHSEDLLKYFIYGGNLTSIPFSSGLLAVKELKEKNLIPENAVFIPGHSGDMLAGSHIPLDYELSQSFTAERFLNDNLKMHYNLWKWDESELGPLFKDRIGKSLGKISINDMDSCVNTLMLFDLNERQAKFIVNMVRSYEFYCYRWSIPLWDAELIELFLSIPIQFRVNQLLYKNYSTKKLFVHDLDSLNNIYCMNNFKIINTAPKFSIKALLLKYSLVRDVVMKILKIKRRYTEYDKHPLAWYGIISRDSFNRKYTGSQNINSFIVLRYVKDICSQPIDSINDRITLPKDDR